MRLFISYARVDKPYCVEIVDTLDVHEVWYDQRLYAGQHWWKEILRRLDWCEGFIYLLSPDSINSEYCRREYELACNLGRHIFPVLIREGTPIPPALADVQYVNFTKGISSETIKNLLNSIYLAERQQPPEMSVASVSPDITKQPATNLANVIRVAGTAMENGHYDQAVFLLKQAKANGYKSRFISIDAILQEAEAALERQSYLIEAEREYRQIAELLKLKRTHKLGLDAFTAFRRDFPDYDPDHLAEKYSVNGFTTPTVNLALRHENPHKTDFTLPLLEWCTVPGGLVELFDQDEAGQRRVRRAEVDTFQISKYPITNKQYQAFIDDPQGYTNPTCWEFDPQAQDWHQNNPTPKSPRFKGDERPRETVNWYEAGAFCQWLGARIGGPVRLPTTAEWQRACQGDDSRHYPWGNTFDQENCNTAESNLKMTTLVTRYTHGASPYGVYDLAGNVWEWCLDGPPIASSQPNEGKKYFVRGGSHISPYQRAHATFRYILAPEIYHSSIGFRVVQV